ncbi:MAG: DUF4011 domain-containing protein [Akkermansia sp.]|nr:DUF4011 domain-containing protein [Akkermansia sp.]
MSATSPENSPSAVNLRISCYRYSSLVYLRNSRPVLWDMELSAAQELRDIRIVVKHEPDFAEDTEWHVGVLPAGKVYHRHGECPQFDDARLSALQEDVPGRITVQVLAEDGTVLAQAGDDFKWLAYNRWAGGHEYPELLAALTLPYDPAVDNVLEDVKKAAGAAEVWPGYTEDAEGVTRRLTSLWDTLASYRLEYALPPKSWLDDNVGQKVRTPSEIMENRCCTCLDSALLFAACTARMGYNPFLVLISGHAFLGVQLQDAFLPHPQGTPVSTVRNLMCQNKLLVFECTNVNGDAATPRKSFEHACAVGAFELNALGDSDYFYALDICQLWEQVGIRPIIGGATEPRKHVNREEQEIVSARPRTRMENWQLKLLDLSLRNPLLNTPLKGKNQLNLLQPDVSALEDMLAGGLSFRVKVVPQTFWNLTSQVQHGEDSDLMRLQLAECVRSMFSKRELAVNMPDSHLSKQMVHLYNTARREMEESGANTLYIACGFLKWYRKGSNLNDKAYLAPLLLLPVRLTRPSVKAGFVLRGTDEESRMNMTLLELLKTEFGVRLPELEGDLPTDASGVDVDRIFNIVRAAISNMPGWEVIEGCSLGVFSFTKYLMWKDLSDREEFLMRNPIVRQIAAEQRSSFPVQVGFPDPATLDNDVEADQVYTPMSSDSSQLSAVLAAARGKNFVLIGPPGTGKSQTITNMIAHCLGHGKTVLFVAEKAAALQVVHKRLKRIGLEDFCLELHSNKANKKNVLAQFKSAVEAVSEGSADDSWAQSAYSLASLRYKLNMLPWELHRKHDDGASLYDDVRNMEQFAHLPAFVPMADDLLTCTAERRQAMESAAHLLSRHYSLLEGVPTPCVQAIRFKDYSLNREEKLAEALAAYAAVDAARETLYLRLMEQLGMDADSHRAAMPALLPALQFAASSGGDDWSFLLPSRAAATMQKLKTLQQQVALYQQNKAGLTLPYPDSTLDNPMLDTWLGETKMLYVSWFLPRFFGMMRMRKNLRALAVSRATPDCLKDLTALVAMREARKAAAAVVGLPEHLHKGLDYSPADAESVNTAAMALKDVLPVDEPVLERLLQRGSVLQLSGSPARETLAAYAEKSTLWQQCRASLAELLGGELADIPQGCETQTWCKSLMEARRNWRDIVIWNSCRATAEADGFAPLAEALLSGSVAAADLENAARVNFSRRRIRAVVESEEALRNFSPAIHEGTISDFAEQDARLMKLATTHIRGSLIKRAADISKFGTETAVLQREISKQKAHMPLRKLMGSVPNITRLLKPCMLMSPLSVAQYLDASTELFDVVIFDEASQIPVWDAIGAIGRGRNAIIVGDPRQMPPTSFFNRAQQQEEDCEQEQDMESILDECLACDIPSLNLSWHYRSKAESLIAFSNANYYESKLTTFPAPMAQDCAVRYHYTAGTYEPGSSKRINMREAQALVNHVLEQLRADGFRYTEASSIGIVTFNAQQQALIQELLDEARAADESLEPYFSESNPEAVFVKNLENVQGDERGVIYFSTTYGPDARGSVSMNFGPLNLAGGERRLNVAVTRARCALHVFTSLKPEDIDLNRTKARGAADFRAFLDYARRGAASYLRLQQGGAAAGADALAEAIAAELQGLGWQCTRSVGVSDYKVDLAVLHPEREDELLAGIAIDGESYAAANTARDRDVLRNSVLTSLGWRMLRVWALDWWQDRERALQNLHAALKQCVEMGPVQPPELPELTAQAGPAGASEPEPEPEPKPVAELPPLLGEPGKEYTPSSTLPPLFEMTDAGLRSAIHSVVEVEGPMKLSFLCKRLRDISFSPAVTPTLRSRIMGMVGELAARGKLVSAPESDDAVLRLPTQAEAMPRACGNRSWGDVPAAELLAIADLVHAHLKCIAGTDDHLRGIAAYLGVARVTRAFKDHLTALLQERNAS